MSYYPTFVVVFVYSDLGVHVDGFISNVAHSFVVGVTKVNHHSCTLTLN